MRTNTIAPRARVVASIVTLLCLGGPVSAEQFEWQQATPESQGMSGPKLDALKDELARPRTRAFLVVRNDTIGYEWHAEGGRGESNQGTASLAKGVDGGLSVGGGLPDGLIALDDQAAKYNPEWKDDPKKARITVRHLGSHPSGLSDSVIRGVKNEEQAGWKGDFWKRLDPPD